MDCENQSTSIENKKCIKNNQKCNCLIIDYENKQKYIDYVGTKFNIHIDLLHTLHLSTKEQLRSYISHYHKYDINKII